MAGWRGDLAFLIVIYFGVFPATAGCGRPYWLNIAIRTSNKVLLATAVVLRGGCSRREKECLLLSTQLADAHLVGLYDP